MELTIKNNSITELTQSVALLLAEERAVKEKLKDIERMKDFYEEEIDSVKHLYHTTRDGKYLLITEMDDNHLINTAVLFYGGSKTRAKKYTDEIKKRGIVKEYFASLKLKKVVEEEEEEEEDYYSDGF